MRLASGAAIQIGLFPDGVCIGDELVSDLDVNIEAIRHRLSPKQRAATQRLDDYVDRLSGPHNEVFWCDPEPLHEDSRWEEIRKLAWKVIEAMGWSYEVHKSDGTIYVFKDRVVRNTSD